MHLSEQTKFWKSEPLSSLLLLVYIIKVFEYYKQTLKAQFLLGEVIFSTTNGCKQL